MGIIKPGRIARLIAPFLPMILAGTITCAQEQSPYAGEERRSIKSLSGREIEGLHSGAGMGLAKPAELNHYPGPKHVLAIAEQIGLSPIQHASTETLYAEMHDKAVELGKQLVEAERQLDAGFHEATIDEDSLRKLLREIGRLRAELRYVHLEAHLRQRQILTDAQVAKYDEIRGY